jgi:hypothetical protein
MQQETSGVNRASQLQGRGDALTAAQAVLRDALIDYDDNLLP